MASLRDKGVIRGWRDETYPLGPAFDAPPSLLIERAAAPYFGMRSYGVHVNGARRAAPRCLSAHFGGRAPAQSV